MITLIIKNNLNIFINEITGRWFCFREKQEDKTIKNVDLNFIKKNYKGNLKVKSYFKEIEKDVKPVNDLLDDLNYLILHTSDACNMKCKYCYAEDNLCDSNGNLMSSDTMICAINKFYKNKPFYVLFHGREPLTNYENILKTINRFQDIKNIKFIIQTNGLLLDDKKIKTLRKYGVGINISIDGIDDDANCLRINGLKNLNYTKKVKKLLEKYKISPIIIIHEKNYKKIIEITKYLIDNGIEGASYNFLWPTKGNKELSKYVLSNETLYKTMKDVFEMSIKNSRFIFKERDLYLLYGRILKRHINNYMCNSAPCGAGKNCISIYKDGEIYPCTMVNGQQENYLGDLEDTNDDIINKQVVLKERKISKIKDCKSCPLRIFCKGGGCPGFIYNYTGDINEKSLYCEYYYNMILFMIEKIFEMSQKKYFINF